MLSASILNDIEQLPPNAQHQLIAFIADLKQRYIQPPENITPSKPSFASIAGMLATKGNGAKLTIDEINEAIVKAAVQANT